MDPERWQRVETVLDAVLARDRAEWPRLLEETCGADPELRREVEALLSQESRADGFLAAPPGAVAAALVDTMDPADLAGRRVGAFRLVRPIGRGGMSRVYLAERADGLFEQQVAVKLLRADLDSPIDLARFAAERRILASLSHPGIARLLDGGVTDDGRPYLVLEHVVGTRIDRYADERRLSPHARLGLFLGGRPDRGSRLERHLREGEGRSEERQGEERAHGKLSTLGQGALMLYSLRIACPPRSSSIVTWLDSLSLV